VIWRGNWGRKRGFGNGENRTKRVPWGRIELRMRVGVLETARWLLLGRDPILRACPGGAEERDGGRRSGSLLGRSLGRDRALRNGIALPKTKKTPLILVRVPVWCNQVKLLQHTKSSKMEKLYLSIYIHTYTLHGFLVSSF